MADLKKITFTFGIAVLLALFVAFTIEAFYQQPKYEDFCRTNYYEPKPVVNIPCSQIVNCTLTPVLGPQSARECESMKGYASYNYSSDGCPSSAYCETCQVRYDNSNKNYNSKLFYLIAIIGLIAILIGLYVPISMEEIASGLILGGAFTLIQGTIRAFGSLGRYSKPIILGIELAIVLLIAYKKRKILKKK